MGWVAFLGTWFFWRETCGCRTVVSGLGGRVAFDREQGLSLRLSSGSASEKLMVRFGVKK